MRTKNWIFSLVLVLFLASCNLPVAKETPPPAANEPAAAEVDVIATAVELTTVAKLTEIAAAAPAAAAASTTQAPANAPSETPGPTLTFTPSPTACTPQVTASTTANLRAGPGTVYEIVGTLFEGKSATVTGRNDANTWWYIEFSGATSGHAWISSVVVASACIPDSVQVVAAPPTPQPTATQKAQPTAKSGPVDLVATGMQWWPSPGKKNQPLSIQVKVSNYGNSSSGPFTLIWYSNQTEVGCTWNFSDLAPGASKDFECQHTYSNSPGSTSTYWVTFKVDTNNNVAESDEGNNMREAEIKVEP